MTSIDRITCDLDFELEGKQFGNLEFSFSNNQHAFDKIPVPIVVIKHGDNLKQWHDRSCLAII